MSDIRPTPQMLHSRLTRLLPWLALAGWVLLAWMSRHPAARPLWWMLGILGVQWILTLYVWRQGSKGQTPHWLIWGLAFRVVGLFALPILEDDHFRFLWDGRMFALTGNPYATTPSEHFADATTPLAFTDILDHVNYPHVPTIYGPLCQLGFLISYLIAPGALWPWKLLLLIADVALVIMLRELSGNKIGNRAAVFAAWCPLSIFETAFNAHPDALAVSVITGALVARQSNRENWLGICCGAAVGAKVFALLLVPFLLWRRRWTAWLCAAATVLVCYAPFWLQGSFADLAGLRTFARDWEFNSSGYALLALALGPEFARPVTTLIFAVAWIGIFWRWVRSNVTQDTLPPGLLVFLLFFLLAPTFNPWYALWLLSFVALQPTLTGVTVLAVVSLSYITRQNLGENSPDTFAHPVWVRCVEFGLIGSALVLEMLRAKSRKDGRLGSPVRA